MLLWAASREEGVLAVSMVCPPGLPGCALPSPAITQLGLRGQGAAGHVLFSLSCSSWWHSELPTGLPDRGGLLSSFLLWERWSFSLPGTKTDESTDAAEAPLSQPLPFPGKLFRHKGRS